MTGHQLVDLIAKRLPGTTKSQIQAFVKAYEESVAEGLQTEGTVSVGKVVKLVVVPTRYLPPRAGTHPVTREPITIKERPAGKKLKARFTKFARSITQ